MEIDDNGNFPTESDHNWIFITLKDNYTNKLYNNLNIKKTKQIWNILEDQDWDNYKQDLENNIHNIDKTTIDTFSDSLIKTITTSMEKNIGKITIGKTWKKKLPKPLIELFKQKRQLFKQYKSLIKTNQEVTTEQQKNLTNLQNAIYETIARIDNNLSNHNTKIR